MIVLEDAGAARTSGLSSVVLGTTAGERPALGGALDDTGTAPASSTSTVASCSGPSCVPPRGRSATPPTLDALRREM